MKFTEEQYQKIVKAWESDQDYVKAVENVIKVVGEFGMGLKFYTAESLALGNERSRKWAHEQFVEKEKRYVWTSKKRNKYGNSHRLYRDMAQSIGFTSVDKTQKTAQDEYLTESEVREWGYNPEMFDKEEAK